MLLKDNIANMRMLLTEKLPPSQDDIEPVGSMLFCNSCNGAGGPAGTPVRRAMMTQRPTLRPIARALATLALLGAAPAFAQQQGANLEEIIVTARFREENLQETPIAITALTTQDIEARAFTNTAQIGYTVPNTYFQKAQAAFGNSMVAFIRGVGQNDFNF